MKKVRVPFSLLLSMLISQAAWAFTVSVNTNLLGFVAGRTSGHEEITRQAMNRFEPILVDAGIDIQSIALELLADREANPFGTKGFSVSNKIIQGNYATDIPGAWTYVFDLALFYGESKGNWQFSPRVQFLHFLQNKNADGTLVSQEETCHVTREQIITNTITGARLWHMGLKRAALFLLGHSSHTIQDSFSPAHTIRDGKDRNNNILKICFYGTAKNPGPDSCYHIPVDPRNGIWIRSPGELARTMRESPHEAAALVPYIPVVTSFNLFGELKESNLKHEARLARTATMRYFYLVASYLKSA